MDNKRNIEIAEGICTVDGHEPTDFTKTIMERVSRGEISPDEGTRLMNEHFKKLVSEGRL